MAKSDQLPGGPHMLALVTDAWGGSGGIAQYNRDFLGALVKSCGTTKVISLVPASTSLGLPEGITQQHSRTGRVEFAIRALIACLQRPRPKFIWCGHINFAPLVAFLCMLFRIPMWLQVHGIDTWERPGFLRRRATERARIVTAVSRYTRRRLLSWANLNPAHVKVLPNTVDERFTPGPKPECLLDRYGLRGKKVLLTVGRLSADERYKGHDRVIESVADLTGDSPDLVYLVVGDGPDRERLQVMVKRLKLDDRVIFAGRVSDEELPDFYRVADVFVMPSTGEGFGIVFLEAAGAGLPVVALESGGASDALRDGEEGALVSLEEQASLTEALANALSGQVGEASNIEFRRGSFESRVARFAQTSQFRKLCGAGHR